MGVLELAVDQAHAFGGELDMGHRRLGRAGGHSQRRLAQDSEGLGGSDAADAMRLHDFGETGLVDLGGPGGGGRAFPQRQEVFRSQVVGQLQHLRGYSATRAAGGSAGQAGALLPRSSAMRDHSRQFDDRGIIDRQPSETRAGRCAKPVAQHVRVAAIGPLASPR